MKGEGRRVVWVCLGGFMFTSRVSRVCLWKKLETSESLNRGMSGTGTDTGLLATGLLATTK